MIDTLHDRYPDEKKPNMIDTLHDRYPDEKKIERRRKYG